MIKRRKKGLVKKVAGPRVRGPAGKDAAAPGPRFPKSPRCIILPKKLIVRCVLRNRLRMLHCTSTQRRDRRLGMLQCTSTRSRLRMQDCTSTKTLLPEGAALHFKSLQKRDCRLGMLQCTSTHSRLRMQGRTSTKTLLPEDAALHLNSEMRLPPGNAAVHLNTLPPEDAGPHLHSLSLWPLFFIKAVLRLS